jgi:hypothetical protein
MENKNKGIFERSEKTVFVWVSKKIPGPTKQQTAASHDSWITKIQSCTNKSNIFSFNSKLKDYI